MKRQLSFRFLGFMLTVVVCIVVVSYFLHIQQVRRNAGYLLTQGKEATARKMYPKAMKYLEHYLTLRPDDATARARYGVILAKLAKTRKEKERAFLTLERALRDGSDLEGALRTDPEVEQEQKNDDPEVAALAADLANVRRRAAEVAIDLLQFTDARVHLEVLLKARPDDAGLLILFGQCEEDGGKPGPAIEAYRRAIQVEPGRVEGYERLAALYRRAGRSDEADQEIEKLLKQNPESVRARIAAVGYYRVHGNLTAARSSLAAVSKAERENQEVLLLGADLALAEKNRADRMAEVAQAKKYESEARNLLGRGHKLYPDEPKFPLMLAELELRSGRRAEAATMLRDLIEKLPKQSLYVWPVADLLVTAGEKAEAEKAVERLRTEQADAVMIDFLVARLRLAEGRTGDAERLLLQCRQNFTNNPVLAPRTELLLATCYEILGKSDLRLKATQNALTFDPSQAGSRSAHADALLAVGNLDEALTIYRTLVAYDPGLRLTIARVVTWQNRLRPIEQRNLAAAYEAIDGAPASLKATAEYYLVRAGVLAAEARKDKLLEAQRMIEAARNKYPKEPQFWIFLAQLAAATSPREGIAILDLAQAEAGDHVALRLARATILTRTATQKPDVTALKALEVGVDRFSDAEQIQLQLGLAESYLQNGNEAEAERLLRQVVARRPNDLGVLARLFEVVATKEDAEEIAAIKLAIRPMEGEDGVVWRFAEALEEWLRYRKDSTETGRLLHAQTRLDEAGTLRPSWFRVPLLAGEIADRLGRPDAAIEKYLTAIRLGARHTALFTRLSTLLYSRGRHEEAQPFINNILSRSPVGSSPPELGKLDALNMLKMGEDRDEVVKRLDRGVPANSTAFQDQLFRGGLLVAVNRPADAEAAFRRAVELKPDTPEVWLALVRFLAQAKREADAKAETEKAKQALPADKQAAVLGYCYEILGDRTTAEKYLLQATRESPTDSAPQRNLAVFFLGGGEAAKAEPILRSLLLDGASASWARRTLALALASSGAYEKGTEALALLDANLRESPDNRDDLRIRSLILANRPGSRGQSIKDLEAAFSQLAPNPTEEYLLAQLYEQDGNWPKANKQMLGMLARRGGDNPEYMAYYVRALLRHDDTPGAAGWLARLQQRIARMEPTEKDRYSSLIVELQARVWVKQGARTKAAETLEQNARKTYEALKDPIVFETTGLLMADLQLTSEAEAMIRQYVAVAEAKTPAAVLVLAVFLARNQNRVPDALTICSTAIAKANPEVVARVAVAVVRLGDVTDADFNKAETIIQEAARVKPESVDILISLADLRDAQGQYAVAKQMYRNIIGRADRSSLAMNNLAWLLALHEGNRDEALRIIGKAIDIRGPEGNLLDTRGVIHLTTGDPAQAVIDLTAAVAQEQSPERYFHLAQAHQKANNLVEATRAMRKARDLNLKKKDLHRLEWNSYDELLGLVGGP